MQLPTVWSFWHESWLPYVVCARIYLLRHESKLHMCLKFTYSDMNQNLAWTWSLLASSWIKTCPISPGHQTKLVFEQPRVMGTNYVPKDPFESAKWLISRISQYCLLQRNVLLVWLYRRVISIQAFESITCWDGRKNGWWCNLNSEMRCVIIITNG